MNDVRIVVEISDALAAIARWYPGTADPPRTVESQTRLAYASKPPISADVLSLRRKTIDRLTSWALIVAEECDLRPGIKTGDVPALTSWLGTHAEWLAGFDGEHAADDLSRLADQLEEVVKQTRPSRVKVGPCPEVACRGTLTAIVRKGDVLLPSAVRCDLSPREHVWEPHDWPALGRRVGMRPEGIARLLVAIGDLPVPRLWGVAPAAMRTGEVVPEVLRGAMWEPEPAAPDEGTA